jgi:hypothetical protein
MNGIIGWISTWDFFKWLTVLGFLMALVGFLNSTLSLWSRFKDWRGVQSKKAFDKRLTELKQLVIKTGEYRREPASYLLPMVYKTLLVISFFILGAPFSFIIAYLLSSMIPFVDTIFLLSACILGLGFVAVSDLLRKIRHVAYPEQIKKEVSKFIATGAKKKLLSEEVGKDMVETLFDQNLITLGEYETLEQLIKEPVPRLP